MIHRHISDELKEVALSMSFQGLSDSDIRKFTGISERSIKPLRNTFHQTGGIRSVSHAHHDGSKGTYVPSLEVVSFLTEAFCN
jgi:hypothetical protein